MLCLSICWLVECVSTWVGSQSVRRTLGITRGDCKCNRESTQTHSLNAAITPEVFCLIVDMFCPGVSCCEIDVENFGNWSPILINSLSNCHVYRQLLFTYVSKGEMYYIIELYNKEVVNYNPPLSSFLLTPLQGIFVSLRVRRKLDRGGL